MDIKGRVALVTGAASGIGKSCAIELLNEGAMVSICDINAEDGEKLAETLSTEYGKDRVIFCQCDVTDYAQFEESFQTTFETFGHIDIVVNNAGIMNDRFWELEVDINVNGVIRGTMLAQRFMGTDRGGQGGIVVNIGSSISINPYTSVPIYSATKAAIVHFTRAFGHQYHVDLTGVKVMALCPSATDSKILGDVSKQLLSPRYVDAWLRDTASSVPQSSLWKCKRCQFHVSVARQKKKKSKGDDGPKIIIPGNCAELSKPILEPMCKNAIVLGGSDGFGFAAADHLLLKGARNTVHKTIRIGLELLGKDNGGSGGIIINCASIFGFLGWPQDPFPIYCNKEPAIEVTRYFAKKYNVETTGVRLVALCPTNKHFRDIGLPIFPDPFPNKTMCELPTCIPHSKYHIGTALNHLLAWAKNGSAWLVEPAISVNQIPQLLHFPEKEGEQVDPKVYETQYCTVKIDPPCAKAKVCTPTKEEMCIKKEKNDKKKKKKKEKK
ncbi:uncharacterized protein LOC122711179 isoform X3 [Apis laboriosa]|uniref:uncharacterized protein LOC122711179 isoform X3 n=1 Tax=Apis laboriosa TaxID=183418 RepID=UPI001CC41A3D|nr:uncharacterized protein LOC122711179 isoform X3 [Apis laboriosa]